MIKDYFWNYGEVSMEIWIFIVNWLLELRGTLQIQKKKNLNRQNNVLDVPLLSTTEQKNLINKFLKKCIQNKNLFQKFFAACGDITIYCDDDYLLEEV